MTRLSPLTTTTTLALLCLGVAFPANVQGQSNNPFEDVGFLHNEALDFVGNFLSIPQDFCPGRDSPVDPLVRATRTFYEALFTPPPPFPETLPCEINNIIPSLDSYPTILFARGQINVRQKDLLDKVYKLVKDAKSATDLNAKLEKFEVSLLKNHHLTEDEKAPIFVASAIAKHSSTYWENAISDPNNPWHSRVSGGPTALKVHLNWWDIGGAIIGGLLGSGGGPGGILVGAGEGATLFSSLGG